jgi:hypothetical protein
MAKKPYKRLTKAEYAKALQHPRWQKKRLRVFQRDKWMCTQCKDKKNNATCPPQKVYQEVSLE